LVLAFILSGGVNRGGGLDEVVLHELLEIEVGKLVLLAELEELGELVVGVDLAAVLLVLELVGANVRVDLLAHGSASHLRANGLAKELGKLVADAGGLHEARGLTVAGRAPLLGAGLLGALHLAGNGLLEVLEVILERGEEPNKLLKLGAILQHLGGHRGIGGNLNNGGGGGNGLLDNRSGDLGGSGLLCTRGLGRGGGGNNGGSSGSRNILSGSDHSGQLYIILRVLFK